MNSSVKHMPYNTNNLILPNIMYWTYPQRIYKIYILRHGRQTSCIIASSHHILL